jgi:flavin-dependent dehydrogenase
MGEAIASYDIVILGGGPAGAAAAIELARNGRAVLVLERSRYDNVRIGETLAPQATQWLELLGILQPFESVPRCVAPGLVSLWDQSAPVEESFRFKSYLNGWHLDRACFDVTLAKAAERAGAVFCRGAVLRSCERSADGRWRVGADVERSRKEIDARWLLDATGRSRWLIRRQGVRPQILDRLIGLLAYVGPRTSSDQRLFIEARPHGWWYSAPLPGDRSIAAFMTDKDLVPHEQGALKAFWEQQRASSQVISCLHNKPSADTELRVVAANSSWSGTVAGKEWLVIGDAAMAHDPLFGLGICHALGSGWTAARALVASLNGDNGAIARYQGWAESCYRDYLDRRASIYSAVTHWPDAKFWNRRARTADPGQGPD